MCLARATSNTRTLSPALIVIPAISFKDNRESPSVAAAVPAAVANDTAADAEAEADAAEVVAAAVRGFVLFVPVFADEGEPFGLEVEGEEEEEEEEEDEEEEEEEEEEGGDVEWSSSLAHLRLW